MGLKKYIFGSIILIIAIFAYTFSIEPGDYTVQIMDFILILPIAAWVVLPLLFLFLMTILHILFYGLKNYFAIKAIAKDSDAIQTLINKKLLNETSKLNFQNKNYKELGILIDQLDINVTNSNFSSDNKNINKTVDQLFTINSGKYVSSKELKLDNYNPIMVQNIKNRISNDDNFALDIVKKHDIYPEEIIKTAFYKILENKSIDKIKKIIEDINFDNAMVISLLKKDGENPDEFIMTNEKILNLIKKVNLNNQQLITIAKNYKLLMTPEQILKLYEDLSVYNEEYTLSYLFVLSEYEMVDKMRDILDNSSPHEYIPFKALLDLKKCGKHSYSLDSLCYK